MPEQPPDPLVTASLIAALAGYNWWNNILLNPHQDGHWFLIVNGSNPGTWGITGPTTTGVRLTQATYTLLKSSTANSDGSFTSDTGTTYWLSPTTDGSGVNWATPVAA